MIGIILLAPTRASKNLAPFLSTALGSSRTSQPPMFSRRTLIRFQFIRRHGQTLQTSHPTGINSWRSPSMSNSPSKNSWRSFQKLPRLDTDIDASSIRVQSAHLDEARLLQAGLVWQAAIPPTGHATWSTENLWFLIISVAWRYHH